MLSSACCTFECIIQINLFKHKQNLISLKKSQNFCLFVKFLFIKKDIGHFKIIKFKRKANDASNTNIYFFFYLCISKTVRAGGA